MILLSITAFAQRSGTLVGSVTDATTGEAIIGATARVLGSTQAASTDVSGKFSLQNLAKGSYTMEFSYIGYTSKQITEVLVQEGDITTLNVLLDAAESALLDQVVVTANFRKETIGARQNGWLGYKSWNEISTYCFKRPRFVKLDFAKAK